MKTLVIAMIFCALATVFIAGAILIQAPAQQHAATR